MASQMSDRWNKWQCQGITYLFCYTCHSFNDKGNNIRTANGTKCPIHRQSLSGATWRSYSSLFSDTSCIYEAEFLQNMLITHFANTSKLLRREFPRVLPLYEEKIRLQRSNKQSTNVYFWVFESRLKNICTTIMLICSTTSLKTWTNLTIRTCELNIYGITSGSTDWADNSPILPNQGIQNTAFANIWSAYYGQSRNIFFNVKIRCFLKGAINETNFRIQFYNLAYKKWQLDCIPI